MQSCAHMWSQGNMSEQANNLQMGNGDLWPTGFGRKINHGHLMAQLSSQFLSTVQKDAICLTGPLHRTQLFAKATFQRGISAVFAFRKCDYRCLRHLAMNHSGSKTAPILSSEARVVKRCTGHAVRRTLKKRAIIFTNLATSG